MDATHSNRMLFMSNVKNFFLPSSSNRRDACDQKQTSEIMCHILDKHSYERGVRFPT